MKIKVNNYFFFDFFLLILSIIFAFLLKPSVIIDNTIAYFLIISSFRLPLKTKNNNILMFLMTIIFLINSSIAINDIINNGKLTAEWQTVGLRNTSINYLSTRIMLIFTSVFSLFLQANRSSKRLNIDKINELRKNNILISGVGIIILYTILVVGIISLSKTFELGSYTYIETTIYEYSIVIFIITYFFSKDKKIINYLLFIFALLFTICFSIFGDRSSSFLYIIMGFLILFPHLIKFELSIIYGFLGIVLSNIISIIRSAGPNISLTFLFKQILEKGLYQDTVSWAYYGGLTGIAIKEFHDYNFKFLFGFLQSIIGIKSEYSDVIGFSRTYYYYNAGGGIFPQHLYAFAGWPGVIIGAIILGIVISKIFASKQNQLNLILILLVTTFCFRWYIYSPLVFFRSSILIPMVLYYIVSSVDEITKKII